MILDGRGRPRCAIRIAAVEILPFDQVSAEFAHAEGDDEDDRSLDAWRRGHAEFFRREGSFAPDMALVCERFELIERFDQGGVFTPGDAD